ncbi:MAG: MATE family efflux transporter, partial [Bacilli bacterium]|nr:MATE family efflux transporter [Bacilli bacterium]
MAKKLTQIDLTKGKEWKQLLLFASPIILSYLLQQVYTISDAAICGQTLSANEVAGVNDAAPLIFIFLQFAFGCTAGFTVITSNRIGNNDYKGVRKSFACQIVLCLIVTLLLTVISILCIDPMLNLINVTKEANIEVYNAAYSYCLVIFLGIIAQMYYNFICSILRSVGDSVTPLIFLFISTVLNIGLDLLFIMVFKMGVIGAALATILAQGLSTIGCFIYTFNKYDYLRLSINDFKNDINEYIMHLKQGLPLGLQFSVLFFGIVILQSKVVLFDILPNG